MVIINKRLCTIENTLWYINMIGDIRGIGNYFLELVLYKGKYPLPNLHTSMPKHEIKLDKFENYILV